MATLDDRSWMHSNLTGIQAEELLLSEGKVGSFLVRYSQSDQGSYRLSVRSPDSIVHIKINNEGDGFVLFPVSGTTETFGTLTSLVKFYMVGGDGYGSLKERNGNLVELKYPLPTSDHSTERFFHRHISGVEATAVLEAFKPGVFLVRPSQTQTGNFVLAVRTDDEKTKVLHVPVNYQKGRYDIGDGAVFRSLTQLVNHYRNNPIQNKAAIKIQLKQAVDRTRFRLTDIDLRIAQLDKLFVVNGEERDGFWEQFEHLERQAVGLAEQNCTSGKLLENKKKNRYKNILPYEDTRVRLKEVDRSIVGSDYINANYIRVDDRTLPDGMRKYIAAQGCMQNTISDFWQMVWQENCSVIVMLTELSEHGKMKCFQYWPQDTVAVSSFEVYGGKLTIEFMSETREKHWILRKFKLIKESSKGKAGGPTRLIYQYHYLSWPDKKVPSVDDIASVVDLMMSVNSRWLSTSASAPLVVHCSAGIGRTGTYIAIDVLIRQIELQGAECEIDVSETVQLLRTQRAGLVQVWHQYRFIYVAVRRFLEVRSQQQTMSQNFDQMTLYANVPASPTGTVIPPLVSRSQQMPQQRPVSAAPATFSRLTTAAGVGSRGGSSSENGIYANVQGKRPPPTLTKKPSIAN